MTDHIALADGRTQTEIMRDMAVKVAQIATREDMPELHQRMMLVMDACDDALGDFTMKRWEAENIVWKPRVVDEGMLKVAEEWDEDIRRGRVEDARDRREDDAATLRVSRGERP